MTDLERTYREIRPRLLNWIKRRLRNQEESEDLLQEVFSKAVETFNVANPVENLVSWLYVAARNAVVDTWRQRDRRPLSMDNQEWDIGPERLITETVDQGPEEAYRRERAVEALEEALADLPDEQREVFVLQAVDGCTFREVAEFLEISLNTAMSRKRYAVAKLRERLRDFNDVIERQEEDNVR